MLYYDRIDVSEGSDINKTSALKTKGTFQNLRERQQNIRG